jgi:peptidoglycan/xylan/chitin deacetylase (PgdA/CDA1 family)
MSALRSLVSGPRLRALVAGGVSATGGYDLLDAVLGRLAGGFILAFHNLPAERFVEHVEALRSSRPVTLSELIERRTQGRSTTGLFAITFDDGVGATVRAITGVARARHWPVTFYVPTGYVGNPRGMPFQWLKAVRPYLPAARIPLPSGELDLTPPGAVAAFAKRMTRLMYTRHPDEYVAPLRELVDALVAQGVVPAEAMVPPPAVTWDEMALLARDPLLQFESHGVSHSALSALAPAELARELEQSRDAIRACTDRPCRHFCYPFGGMESIGTRTPALVAEYYASAVTMARGRLGGASLHLLPRIPLYPEDDGRVARLKVLTT